MRCYTGQDGILRRRMYDEIAQRLKSGRRAYLLVPEQYTLEAELDAFEQLKLNGSFDFQVLSPARLFSRVFEATGRPAQTRVDERGRVTLLSALMGEIELSRYKNAQRKPGFAERMALEIARCKQSGLTPDNLLASAEQMGPCALSDKLRDTAAVWSAYEKELSGRFLDGEDERFRALERVPQADFLQGAAVWARGFELVSPALCDILRALDGACEGVTLLISCSRGRDGECWEPVTASLARMSQRFGGQAAFTHLPDPPVAGETDFLAREMSAYPAHAWPDAPRAVSVAALKTPEEEACYAVGLIREMARTNGWRYRDCAILCENMADYADRLSRAAALYGVPLFAEETRPASSHPSAQYLLLSLRLIGRGYPAAEARLLLRTGLTALTPDECDILSNYIYEFGIRGGLWKKPFARGGEKRAAAAEPLREKFIGPFLALEGRVKSARTAGELLKALWQLAEEAGLADQLTRESARLFEEGRMVEAAECAQIWNRVIGEFDQLYELLGDKRMKPQELSRLLEAGLSACQVSPLPQSNDAVCAASVSRIRSRPFQLIVLVGASDAQPIRDDGLFDSTERARLEEASGAWFPPDGDGRMRLRALDYKNAVSLAKARLAITYPLGANGDRSAFGYPIRWARRVFPALREESAEAILRAMYSAPEAARVLAFAASRSSGARREKELALSALREADCAAPSAPQDDRLDARLAQKLYGGPASVHVTRLETFAACPFRHFVQYGLKPYLMRPFEYELRDRGELVHRAMDQLFRETVPGETPQAAMERAEGIVRALTDTELGERMRDDPLSQALAQGLIRRARAAADAAMFQLQGSAFRVAATESSFGEMRPLVFAPTPDLSIPLSGRIDRMDLWRGEEGAFVRVVDYKSSRSHTLDFVKLYYALQLQLPVYLAAARQLYRAQGAGAYYLPAVGLVPQTDERDPESVAMLRREKLALSGVTASDPAILAASSPNLKATLGIRLKNDGTPYKSNKALPREQVEALSRFALRQAGRLTHRLRQGDAQVDPVRCGQESACQFCEFMAACRVDGPLRRLPPLSAEEALERILRESAEPGSL